MYRCLSHRLDGVYNNQRRETVGREVLLKKEIKTAIDEKQFVLHYQPQIEIASGRLVGAEALLRWKHWLQAVLFRPSKKSESSIPLGNGQYTKLVGRRFSGRRRVILIQRHR